MAHSEKMDAPCEVHVLFRSGSETSIWADEIITPNNEMGLVRFKLSMSVQACRQGRRNCARQSVRRLVGMP